MRFSIQIDPNCLRGVIIGISLIAWRKLISRADRSVVATTIERWILARPNRFPLRRPTNPVDKAFSEK